MAVNPQSASIRPRAGFWMSVAGVGVLGGVMAGLSVDREVSQSKANQQVTATGTLPARPRFLQNLPGMVDQTVRYESAAEFSTGRFDSTTLISAEPARVVLADSKPRDYPREGIWTTPIVNAALPFTEFLPSWNADVPTNSGVAFEARVRDHQKQSWSPWLYIGSWGRPAPFEHVEKFDGGKLSIDNLQLTRPADAFQVRVRFASYSVDPKEVPSLRRLHVIYSGMPSDAEKSKWAQSTTRVMVVTGWDRSLPVAYRPQGDAPPNLSYQLCSPTSTSMVLDYWGVGHPLVDNALAIWDPDHDMFGNWGRAVQYAGSLGLDAWLERFRNWDGVKAKIASGQPVIASIKFGYGEFPSSVLSHSNGHLIVIRGFTKEGDVICNDPGNRAKGNGVVYKANELGHAWFDHGGVGYIIRGKSPVSSTHPTTAPATQAVAGDGGGSAL